MSETLTEMDQRVITALACNMETKRACNIYESLWGETISREEMDESLTRLGRLKFQEVPPP